MKKHPETIAHLQIKINAQTNQIHDLRERLDLMEADITIAIHTEKTEAGKPVFPNDELRKAEFLKRCAASEPVKKLAGELRMLETQRIQTLALLEQRRLEFKLFLLDRQAEIQA